MADRRCTFKQGQWNCGSYQFNLYKDDIDQGDLCDVHYWQDRAQRAEAKPEQEPEPDELTVVYMSGVFEGRKLEREACAKVCESHVRQPSRLHFAAAIRARGNK